MELRYTILNSKSLYHVNITILFFHNFNLKITTKHSKSLMFLLLFLYQIQAAIFIFIKNSRSPQPLIVTSQLFISRLIILN